MKNLLNGSGSSLAGVALLAACACGTSTGLVKMSGMQDQMVSRQFFYLPFIVLGLGLIVQGLFRLGRRSGVIALAGAALILVGNLRVEEMSIDASTVLGAAQIAGLFAYIAGAALLVWAFYQAFPSTQPGASLMAMSGMAMATGCSCCQITMALTSLAVRAVPAAHWLRTTEAAYIPAAVLMVIGLSRLGGAVPAISVLAGQAIGFFGLEVAVPNVQIGGHPAAFLVKFPIMLTGSAIMMFAFARAFAASEVTSTATFAELNTAGD